MLAVQVVYMTSITSAPCPVPPSSIQTLEKKNLCPYLFIFRTLQGPSLLHRGSTERSDCRRRKESGGGLDARWISRLLRLQSPCKADSITNAPLNLCGGERQGPLIPGFGFGFPRTLYAVQSEQSYCIARHVSNRVLLNEIFSDAKTTYFRGKLKIEAVLKIKRYGQRLTQRYSAVEGSG